MIDFKSFSDELKKISVDRAAVVNRLPQDREKALDLISRRIDKSKTEIFGFPTVAVPVKRMGELADYGFKKTRMAVPLPWESPGTASWRKGKLHAHKKEDMFVIHKDDIIPSGVAGSMKHWVKEGLPAMRKRLKQNESGAFPF